MEFLQIRNYNFGDSQVFQGVHVFQLITEIT